MRTEHDTGESDPGADARRRWSRRLSTLSTALLVALAVYGASYLFLRASHQLLCTGWFYNVKDATTGRHTRDAEWRDVAIRATNRDLAWAETLYQPAILAECAWRRQFGGEP